MIWMLEHVGFLAACAGGVRATPEGPPPGSMPSPRMAGCGVPVQKAPEQVTQGSPGSQASLVTHLPPPASNAQASDKKNTSKDVFYFWSNC